MRQADPAGAKALHTVSSIATVPMLLEMLREMTGLGFLAVARVTEFSWTACAVHDAIDFGLQVGAQLDVGTTFCAQVRKSRVPIVIDHASVDPLYRDSLTPKIYGFESMVTVPIVLPHGEYFGALFGVDRQPRNVSEPWVLDLFDRVAHIVALQLNDARPTHQCEELVNALAAELTKPIDALHHAADQLLQHRGNALPAALAANLQRQARHLDAITDQMRDIARGTSGRRIATRLEANVNLDLLLERMLDDTRRAKPERKIIANIAIGRSLRCDPTRMVQLASHLLNAALSQAEPGGPVSIVAMLEEAMLSIDVWNGGESIPGDRLHELFAASWQPSATRSRIDSLNLHRCRLIADAHEGVISVTSARDQGTLFSVRIPVPTARAEGYATSSRV